ncbi:DsrE family protein [Solidesulfovibrio sp.]|uniref:DsrE family protein n=1 Tax=Solidesulfovibrio sp. TaxID=2910990 RepID=UPI00261D2553|nr:DsrE family protein [Solidesulfovibrio sp.]
MGLVVVWTTREREAALAMALVYARNALLRGHFARVRLLVWGPSAKVLACDPELQEAVVACRAAGVDVAACRECAEVFEVAECLSRLGLALVAGDATLSDALKDGWKVVSV